MVLLDRSDWEVVQNLTERSLEHTDKEAKEAFLLFVCLFFKDRVALPGLELI